MCEMRRFPRPPASPTTPDGRPGLEPHAPPSGVLRHMNGSMRVREASTEDADAMTDLHTRARSAYYAAGGQTAPVGPARGEPTTCAWVCASAEWR